MKDIIAVIFDFDDTLAEDSTTAFLESIGIDTYDFWKVKVQALLNDEWDPIPAYLYQMLKESKEGKVITKEKLSSFAKDISFFKGVHKLFSNLQKMAEEHEDIELEFYLISSGIGDVIRSSKIAKNFKEIFSSEFEYNKKGEIVFPKRVVSFTDKTRFLYSISKGFIGSEYRNKPFEVNRKIEKETYRIPFANMIFVGDGYTDIPCFSLLKKMKGTTIGVYDPHNKSKWENAWEFVEDNRTSNLVPADYTKGSALMNSLEMAINAIARRIALKKH